MTISLMRTHKEKIKNKIIKIIKYLVLMTIFFFKILPCNRHEGYYILYTTHIITSATMWTRLNRFFVNFGCMLQKLTR